METLIEYLAFVENQRTLKARAEEVVKLIYKLYPKKYDLYQDIEQIKFYEDEVMVVSKATFRGSTDSSWTDFPSQWLFLPNDEIEVIVLAQKAEDNKQQAEKEAKATADKQAQKDQQDLALYETLKKKFETM
jgi:hypothetical protein